MIARPRRLRRCQLSAPGSSEKMLAKAAASTADHVFCDLEDAVAPSAKVDARAKVAHALNHHDWGKKTRSIRINDVTTEWCHGDVITVVEMAGARLDTIILTKACSAADVLFLDRLLLQLEKRLRLTDRIGIEVLIEEVRGLQNVEAISRCSDRVEALIFGMGDYAASQGMDTVDIGVTGDYPGDMFHYARFRVAMAARAAGIDAIDGPFGNLSDIDAFRREARRAKSLGLAGKWAIHPSQIEPALEVFSPTIAEVTRARRIQSAFLDAQREGLGSAQVDGMMVDNASLRLVANILSQAELIGI